MATELKDRIKVGLDESRMIVLVVQVLLGFECRAAFEAGFEKLPAAAQTMKMVSFALLMVSLACLLAIPAFHRIAAGGHTTHGTERALRRLLTSALWPFAVALGLDLGIAAFTLFGRTVAIVTAAGVSALALICWSGLGYLHARTKPSATGENMDEDNEHASLEEKIKQVLTECRIVLPGTQAFLGFQLSAFLTDAFGKLGRPEQLLHLGALGLVALSGIILMTPPAYHRIGEKGQMTPQFLRFASILLVCAMVPLALGICVDFYVVLAKVTQMPALAFGCSAAALLMFVGFWFVLPTYARARNGRGSSARATVHGRATAKTA